ncbi:MAG TPA: DUF4476 domain-containing protein [Cytophagales bacterium]|nr:DUF4476 domain-containing protein [Cytophagales bacterium]
MKTNVIVSLVFVMLSLNAFSNDYSHDPRSRRHRTPHYARRVVVLPPSPRVVIPPPARVYFAPPVPIRYVHVVVRHPRPVSENEAIRNAKNMIHDQRFEADRLRIAKNAAADLPFKAVDILDVMNMFNFESSKLDFAKFAYDKTVDPENYSVVFEAFKYTSSIKNLEDYIYNGR